MTQLSSSSSLLATRYVNALLAQAEQAGGFAPLMADITRFEALWAESADLRRLLSSPLISARHMQAAVIATMTAAQMGDLIKAFTASVIQNGRGAYLAPFFEAARAEIDRRQGMVKADVQVAAPLTEAQMRALQERLSTMTGGQVQIQAHVDPSLLGGMKVRIGSMQVDDSVAGKLARLKQVLQIAGDAA